MRTASNLTGLGLAFAAMAVALGLSGCGTPAAPQPPSLKLPELVTDLSAERTGDHVSLHWTMPRKTTDRELLTGPVTVRVWRTAALGTPQVAATLTFPPAAPASFDETLPGPLAAGPIRRLDYAVELLGKRGRSAGVCAAVPVASGQAPAALANVTAVPTATGIALRWNAAGPGVGVLLHRHLVSGGAKPHDGVLSAPEEAADQDFRVPAAAPGTLDTTARFGRTYQYTAQPVESAPEAPALQVAGPLAAPVRVSYTDSFPPAIPQGLVTVPVSADGATPASIDLSWQPDTDPDLAGYLVYRAEGDSGWQRISGATALSAPAFRDTQIQPGHSYRYAVTAIDFTGNESKRSTEASETAAAAN